MVGLGPRGRAAGRDARVDQKSRGAKSSFEGAQARAFSLVIFQCINLWRSAPRKYLHGQLRDPLAPFPIDINFDARLSSGACTASISRPRLPCGACTIGQIPSCRCRTCPPPGPSPTPGAAAGARTRSSLARWTAACASTSSPTATACAPAPPGQPGGRAARGRCQPAIQHLPPHRLRFRHGWKAARNEHWNPPHCLLFLWRGEE